MFAKLDIGPIKARLSAITAWPWREVAESSEWWIEGDMQDSIDGKYPPIIIPDTADLYQPDVDFIAAAPSDVAALVAEVEQLRIVLGQIVSYDATSLQRVVNFHDDPTHCAECGEENNTHTVDCPVVYARQLLGISG